MTVTRLSVLAARGERSSRLPSGVATTYRVPAISPRHRPRQASVVTRRLQHVAVLARGLTQDLGRGADRKSTRLNSSHGYISYAVFCLKKKRRSPCAVARCITSALERCPGDSVRLSRP